MRLWYKVCVCLYEAFKNLDASQKGIFFMITEKKIWVVLANVLDGK
jgi:hypothetical protein